MKSKGFTECLNDLADGLEYLGSERYELASTLITIANNEAAWEAAKRHPGLYGEIVRSVIEWAVSKYEYHMSFATGTSKDLFPEKEPYVEGEVYLMLDALAAELRRRSNRSAGSFVS